MNAELRARLAEELAGICGTDNVLLDEAMAEHTTFRIGGPAAIYAVPEGAEAAAAAVAACRAAGVEMLVLGAGSDLLVSDAGFDGAVIAVGDGLGDMAVVGNRLICEAGVLLADAAELACQLGLSGLEFACGIPGTIGGACFMNAGAYGGCMADVLESVEVLNAAGEQMTLAVDELALGYRASRIADEGLIVLSATLALEAGEVAAIRATMDELTAQREEKQPLELPSAGSTFKRPEGYFAGKLITDAGLKGYRSGDAAVSEKHAGFVVNLGGASASDVLAVISHVQDEVRRQFGVELEPEVRMIGF